MKINSGWLLLAALLIPGTGVGQMAHDLKPYPEQIDGLTRWVFELPAGTDETARQVEIIVGKMLEVDCNRASFRGDLEQRTAEGWGYPYFVLEQAAGPVATLMACPPGEAKTEAFVPVIGDGYQQRYNSKLPVVVYVPAGFSVRYRVWSAGEEIEQATPQ